MQGKTEEHNCTDNVSVVVLNQHKLSLNNMMLYLRNKFEFSTILTRITKLVKLLFTLPRTPCENEPFFSTFRQLKSYLRFTMLSQRLDELTLFHVYCKI